MGKTLTSLITIALTIALMTVGTVAYLTGPKVFLSNTFASETVDLVMTTDNWNNGWLVWDERTCNERITKSIILKNTGTSPGRLFLTFDYSPSNDTIAHNILVTDIWHDNCQKIMDWSEKPSSLSLYDLKHHQPWNLGILQSNSQTTYRFVFSLNPNIKSKNISIKIIVKATLSQYSSLQ